MTSVTKTTALLILSTLVMIVTIGNIGFYAGRTVGISNAHPDNFMIINSVTIDNSPFGQDPIMHVDRIIFQPFRGRWTVEINTEDGEYVCSATDSTVYTPSSNLPSDVRLFNWWMLGGDSPEELCLHEMYPLPVGGYRVDTVWEATNSEGVNITIFSRSNVFYVTP